MKLNLALLSLALPLVLSACGEAREPAAPSEPATMSEVGHRDEGPSNGHGEAEHEEDGHEDDEAARIVLTSEQVKAAGIEVVLCGPAEIRETLPLYGVIAPNAEHVREVGARFPGVVRTVNKKLGDPVRAGETLATIEANESLQTYTVTAPLGGVVTARNANPGEQTGEKTLFTVADLSSVWVELSLFPRDATKVRVGQSVRVKSTDAGFVADGTLVYVAPFGQAANQTLTARVLLANPERRWAPGIYVTAEVTLAETSVPLAIHSDAVQTLNDRTVVFVQKEGAFTPRTVVLGRSDGEFVEVVSGLRASETYASANSFILKAELGKGSAEHDH